MSKKPSIDRNSEVPMHTQLTRILSDSIQRGEVSDGKLPSESQLAKDYQVSRITVRQALTNLEKAGKIKKRHAVGAFVTDKPITHEFHAKAVTIVEALQEQGIEPVVELLGFTQEDSPAFAKNRLGDVPVKRLRRLYSHKTQPIALVDLYLPLAMSGVGEVLCQLNHRTATSYSVFEKELNIVISEAKHVIRCVQMEDDVADALGVPAGTTCMAMDRTTYSLAGIVLECVRFYYASDIFQFEVTLQRNEAPLGVKVSDRLIRSSKT